jgi:hypothetical protein
MVTFDECFDCLEKVQNLFILMTERGMFDQLLEDYSHPDEINDLCDEVRNILHRSGRLEN